MVVTVYQQLKSSYVQNGCVCLEAIVTISFITTMNVNFFFVIAIYVFVFNCIVCLQV